MIDQKRVDKKSTLFFELSVIIVAFKNVD